MFDAEFMKQLSNVLSEMLDEKLDEKFEMNNAILRAEIAKVDAKVSELQTNVKDIKLTIDHEINPQIQLLTENYVPAAKRFEAATNEMGVMKTDIDVLKWTARQHSAQLRTLVPAT